MTRSLSRGNPPVYFIDSEADSLANLALGVANSMPDVSDLLLSEITRAKVQSPSRIGADVVTMHSTVEFVDEASGADRTVQIVYPAQADISVGRVSILTPIAAGLIGLREGQSIEWPDRDGRTRTLTVVKVTQPTRI